MASAPPPPPCRAAALVSESRNVQRVRAALVQCGWLKAGKNVTPTQECDVDDGGASGRSSDTGGSGSASQRQRLLLAVHLNPLGCRRVPLLLAESAVAGSPAETELQALLRSGDARFVAGLRVSSAASARANVVHVVQASSPGAASGPPPSLQAAVPSTRCCTPDYSCTPDPY